MRQELFIDKVYTNGIGNDRLGVGYISAHRLQLLLQVSWTAKIGNGDVDEGWCERTDRASCFQGQQKLERVAHGVYEQNKKEKYSD